MFLMFLRLKKKKKNRALCIDNTGFVVRLSTFLLRLLPSLIWNNYELVRLLPSLIHTALLTFDFHVDNIATLYFIVAYTRSWS